jgi:hypothetical protein
MSGPGAALVDAESTSQARFHYEVVAEFQILPQLGLVLPARLRWESTCGTDGFRSDLSRWRLGLIHSLVGVPCTSTMRLPPTAAAGLSDARTDAESRPPSRRRTKAHGRAGTTSARRWKA